LILLLTVSKKEQQLRYHVLIPTHLNLHRNMFSNQIQSISWLNIMKIGIVWGIHHLSPKILNRLFIVTQHSAP